MLQTSFVELSITALAGAADDGAEAACCNALLDAAEEATLLGGEICSWDVLFDGTNLLSNIFPRAIAVAERLWSDKSVRNLDSAANRILPQRCRMVARGIPAAPIAMADHCPFPFEFEYSSPAYVDGL